MNRVLLAILLVQLAGCATVIRGVNEDVSITTTPPGAIASLPTGKSCTTPCTLNVARKETVLLKISKPGCTDVQETLLPAVGASFMFSGVVDYGSGAAYHHEPNPVDEIMTCTTP